MFGLLLLAACQPGGPPGDPTDVDLDTAQPHTGDSDPADSGPGDSNQDDSDPGDSDSGDSDAALPYGDNLVRLGAYEPFSNMEALGVLALDGDLLFMCAGVASPSLFDVADPASPLLLGTLGFPAPATGPRCQHLAPLGSGRVVVTHHGDEMGDPWLGVADVSDPIHPIGVDAWARAELEPEGVDTVGDTAWVAAHTDGLLTFDLSGATIPEPSRHDLGGRNAYAVRVRGETVAVGTVEGTVVLVDLAGAPLGEVPVSGPVRDLAWADDTTLYVACGASGVDRIDVGALTVTGHTDGLGSAMDLALLADGALAVAAYSLLAVYDADLALVATEDPASAGEDVALLAIDTRGEGVFVGEWQHLWTYGWDPTVAAPDIRPDRDAITLPDAEAGEATAFALVVRNDGPQELIVHEVVAGAGIAVSESALTIPAAGADVVELSWTSDGLELSSTVMLRSNDPDEPEVVLGITANSERPGVGDPLPAFTYPAVNGTGTYDSADLGGPALLSYFATF